MPENREAVVIYTLGYEKRDLAGYAAILREAGAAVVLDVRDTAWSHKQEFCKKRLAAGLADAGIEYVHIPEAGNPKRLRKSGASMDEILALYDAHLAGTESGLEALMQLVQKADLEGKRACLMCFERDPAQCHRSVLVRHLQERYPGVTVIHL